MNIRMLARSNGGFTTCLVPRADPDGALTLDNAGHIPPYLDGRDLPLDNGLPLGLAAEAAYPESNFPLPPNTQLTLITDGVVEARNQSAKSIAQAAQNFGQEDDITVPTLTRLSFVPSSAPNHKRLRRTQ